MSNFKNEYQYDTLGYVEDITPSAKSSNSYFANVFTKKAQDTNVDAAAFYTEEENMSYKIYVCPNYTKPANLTSSKVLATSGTLQYGGYHTVKFTTPVALKGTKFAVIVCLTSSDGLHNIPVEATYSGYSINNGAKAGQSYYSPNGNGLTWKDAVSSNRTASICLKAFSSASAAHK